MNSIPNIFNYATSELSQDAVISWLLNWANPINKDKNNNLHAIGKYFLESLLEKKGIALGDVTCIEIKQQYKSIDVFVHLIMDGKTYGIIIEDKVYSSSHSNQLKKYKEKIEKEGYVNLICIYFKTGFQADLKGEINDGFLHYSVKDFIKVFDFGSKLGAGSEILICYYKYLKELEKQYLEAEASFLSYKTKNINEWNWWNWSGFFNDISGELKAGWGEVGNRREKLLACWFKGKELRINYNGEEFIFAPYVDILCSDNRYSINYRLDLNGNSVEDRKLRDLIIDKFKPFLDKNEIAYKRPAFKKAKETILLLKLGGNRKNDIILENMYHSELLMFLKKLQSVLLEVVS